MISVENVNHKWDDGTIALQNVDFEIPKGEIVALMGASGSGKSTILNILSGAVSPSSGDVMVDGKIPTVGNRSIGVINQNVELLPWRSVSGNIDLGLMLNGYDKDKRKDKILEVLEEVSLSDKAGKYPNELSGGEYQRVAIARLLALSFPYILMDEPFAALDYVGRARMHQFLKKINVQFQNSIVLVTHHIDEALMIADRVIYLSKVERKIVEDIALDTDNSGQVRQEVIDDLSVKIKNLLLNDQ